MSYTHLSTAERIQLYTLRFKDKLSMTAIAIGAIMKRATSTISRELRRNTDKTYGDYLPDTAQEKMRIRRASSKGKFRSISDTTIEEIKRHLNQYHSPEQLAGRIKREGKATASDENILPTIKA